MESKASTLLDHHFHQVMGYCRVLGGCPALPRQMHVSGHTRDSARISDQNVFAISRHEIFVMVQLC